MTKTKTRMLRLGFVTAATAAVLGFGASPSQAATQGVINFTGTASVASPGLGYPQLFPARTLAFGFSSTTCADSSGSAACSISVTSANGSVTGNCGLSHGHASGTISGVPGGPYGFSVSWTEAPGVPPSVGGTLILTGSAGSGGTAVGEVTAVPTTGSCASGNATGFTIVGNVAYTIP